jgi:transcriptional regulator with XRE-family HTH domain
MTPEIDGPSALTVHFRRQAGGALRQARLRAGLSQQDVANRASVPLTIVEHVEDGDTSDITLQQFMDLALVSGAVPLELLLIPIEEAELFTSEHSRPPSVTDLESWKARRAVRSALEQARGTAKTRG